MTENQIATSAQPDTTTPPQASATPSQAQAPAPPDPYAAYGGSVAPVTAPNGSQSIPPSDPYAAYGGSVVPGENESYGTPEEQQAAAARHALTRVGKTNTPEMTTDEITNGLAGLLGGRGPEVHGSLDAARQVARKLLTGFGVNAAKDVEGVGHMERAVSAALISHVTGLPYEQAKQAITPRFLTNEQGTGLLDANQNETEGGLETVGGMGETILSFLATEGALKGLSLGQRLAEVKRVADILEKGGPAAKALRIGMNATRVGSASGIQTGVRGGTPEEIATSAAIGAGGTVAIEGGASVLKPAAQKLFSWVNAPKDLEAAEAALQATKEGSPDALAKAKDALLPNKGLEGTELAEKVQTNLEAASAKKSADYEAARNSVTDQVAAAEKAGKPIRVGGNGSPIQQQAAEFATAPSGLPEGFQDVFNKVNPATDPKIAPLLNKFADEMTQPMSWDEAEKMRQQIGNAVRNTPYGDPTKWQWISMRNAMDETMEKAATDAGYPEISKDMMTLRSNYAEALNRLEKNSVIKSLKDKDYDSVAKRLMSGNQVIQNVEDLRTTLKSVGGEDTMSAVENSVAQKLIDSATTTTADGTKQVNPNTLANKFFALSPDVREALWHENAPEIEKIISNFKTEIESGKAAVAAGKESTVFNQNSVIAKVFGFSAKHIAAAPFLYTAFHKLENGDIGGAVQDTVYGLAAGAGQHVAGKIAGNAAVQSKVLSFLEYLSHISETGAEEGGAASAFPKVPSLRPTGFSAGIPFKGIGEGGEEAEAANTAKTGLPEGTKIPGAQVPPNTTVQKTQAKVKAEGKSTLAPLPPQPRLPDVGTHAAIKTDDGSIYFDNAPEKQRTHIMLAQDLGIPPERIVSGGWLSDGHYEASERSDAGRWGERARAAARVKEAREAAKAEADFSKDAKDFVDEAYLPEGEANLYHVTTAKDKVLNEGLKSRAQTKTVGLGGGFNNQAPDRVSVTFDEGHAAAIANRMETAVRAARDEMTPQQALSRIISDSGLDDSEPREIAEALKAPKDTYEDWEAFDKWFDENYKKGDAYTVVQELDDAMPEIFSGAENPVRVGLTASKEQMAKTDPDQIHTFQIEARRGAKPSHIPDEAELRFRPEDVRVVKDEPEIEAINESHPSAKAYHEGNYTDAFQEGIRNHQAVEPEVEVVEPSGVQDNGSRGGANSVEAVNRSQSERAAGKSYVRIDTRLPLNSPAREMKIPSGVDAVDAKAGPHEKIIQRQPGRPDVVLDRGSKAKD
jgi:hypothetical protein